jgi:4-amino-4-deoxy-L-arabinose transferase-like glycosyltransferase
MALRIAAAASAWPVTTTLADSGAYARYAMTNPLADPQHPAGYSALLAVVGVFSRQVAVVTILQHLLGIGAALLFYGAVTRLTGSRWAGLVPAAVVLLNADIVFLEQNVLSETFFLAALAAALYGAVRACEAPNPWWRWPAASATLVALSTVIRPAALFLLPVIVLAIWLADPRPLRVRWRAPLGAAAVGAVLVALYASANLASNGRFEVGPAQGWHLYGRVATFADCTQFTPPAGTKGLCERTPASKRPNGQFYMYDGSSPLARVFGPNAWRKHDDDLRAFATQTILHQPLWYAKTMWRDVKTYFAPNVQAGPHLDGELDWSRADLAGTALPDSTAQVMESFFDPFHPRASSGTVGFLHGYQRIFRFGATLLVITSVLTAIGLLVGPRRSRVGVLLFGIGGLALLVAPVLSVFYVARYMVPIAAPIAAAAAITALTLRRLDVQRSSHVEDTRAQEYEGGPRDDHHGAEVDDLLSGAE